MNIDDVKQAIIQEMRRLVADNKQHEVKATSIPSAPDTFKFRASVSGMIELDRNVVTYRGYQSMFRTTYDHFIKIGGGVDRNVSRGIIEELIGFINIEFIAPDAPEFGAHSTLQCDDGALAFGVESGTNWGGVGFTIYPKKV